MLKRLWLLDHHQEAIVIPAILLAGTTFYFTPMLTIPMLGIYALIVMLVLPNLRGGNIHRPDDIRFIFGALASAAIISTVGALVTPAIMFAYIPVLSVMMRKLREKVSVLGSLVKSDVGIRL